MLSGISETQKVKYCMISLTCRILFFKKVKYAEIDNKTGLPGAGLQRRKEQGLKEYDTNTWRKISRQKEQPAKKDKRATEKQAHD